jgi:hypothetical protein
LAPAAALVACAALLALAAAVFVWAALGGWARLHPTVSPPDWPEVDPWLLGMAVLLAVPGLLVERER